MTHNIINEIRRMERKYCSKHGTRGTTIYLDAKTESRIASYLVLELSRKECFLTLILYDDPKIAMDDILEYGIRHLDLKIAGMDLKFDCQSFCIMDSNTFSCE